ncbi:ABC transporter substrate-binding protein [Sulfurimonas microaerophilic]|uniref:ABC transporter substrate-binding protein n=1 Tax=Sulfurimonas microaerophilic TaxID=3058392 RepID=UPI002714792B|nr:ABC transporter substrate-binding protein [Sulfurimonas sp. hsl 1-7]
MNFFIPLLVFLLAISLQAKTVEDFYHNQVKVPEKITKVFGSSPPMNYLIYALNPKKMVGLNFKAKNPNNFATKEYLDPYFLSLPVIGTFHSTGAGINLETLLIRRPDLILVWADDMMVATVEKSIQRSKFPTFTVPFRKIEDIPRAIKVTADAIDEQNRGKLLSTYAQKSIDEIKTKLENVKDIRYYYAEGNDGLQTECDKSFHVEAMNFAGGENVHKCKQSNLRGLEQINIETLYKYNPEVIIAQNRMVYKNLFHNQLFHNLDAVKNKRVYLVPNTPFNWIDRPPSFMRVIGIEWLAHTFHPEVYNINLNKRIKEFYKLFLQVEITNKQIQTILGEDQE